MVLVRRWSRMVPGVLLRSVGLLAGGFLAGGVFLRAGAVFVRRSRMVARTGGKSGSRMVAGAVFGTFTGGETLVEVGFPLERCVDSGFELRCLVGCGLISNRFQFDWGAATIGGFTAGERVSYVFFRWLSFFRSASAGCVWLAHTRSVSLT
jgi:hypothetical protein